jgi:Curlin associated repeat
MQKYFYTIAALLAAFSSAGFADVHSNTIEVMEVGVTGPNLIELSVSGRHNVLQINRNGANSTENSIHIAITGNHNGGAAGSFFSGNAARNGLMPGTLVQDGYGNDLVLTVNGSRNLFAFYQSGTGNAATARIKGTSNQASVQQIGNYNYASISQTGTGNRISISQRSW